VSRDALLYLEVLWNVVSVEVPRLLSSVQEIIQAENNNTGER
jgi:hypothetical protein